MSTPSPPPVKRVLFTRLPIGERTFIADALRQETVGGALLLSAALAGLIIANSAWSDAYENLKDFVVGPAAINLDLSLETWAADGLLAIFFFVAGLELKRELVVGTLRERSQAVLPVVAAAGGMIIPALIFLAITSATKPPGPDGPFRWRPTSPSPWLSLRSSGLTFRQLCVPSC